MPFVRNPFRKQDENVRPVYDARSNSDAGKSAEISDADTVEYKLSDINDSGICLPPSPTLERKSFWHTNSSRSTTSSNHRSLVNEAEQFNISRESFDSYRRSFDISGRSPVMRPNEFNQRGSLDSRSFQSPTRTSNTFVRPLPVPIVPPVMKEEDFEDVGLDEAKPQPVKKKGLFARLTESSNDHSSTANGTDGRPGSSHEKSSWHHFGARKRGQSGQGSELGSYPGLQTPKREETPKPGDSSLRSPATPTPETVKAPIA
ncbi:hypothetical protein AMS68_007450 [Peltaster fructicola]|uniref:Uncharacterized protein n=1 Tax=Peltaster fructicola TaxID=286661 RepID=A0A6H0Y4K9_9PEZI|nr:hypothetical protein AMS68_007450 [Peltaster fructicola]